MAPAAAQVLASVAAALAAVPATAGRVYAERSHPLTEAELPAWRVSAAVETVEQATVEGITQHTLEITCEGVARHTAALPDMLDTLAAQGMAALFGGPPGALIGGLSPQGVERSLANEGEAAVGVLTLRLAGLYFTHPGQPGVIVS